jgi:hypothetical protein
MPLRGACCELSRYEPVEARVRSVGVVVDLPGFDHAPSHPQASEQMLVEAFVADTFSHVCNFGVDDAQCIRAHPEQAHSKRGGPAAYNILDQCDRLTAPPIRLVAL